MSTDKHNYYPALDGIRAIAVIAVVLFHLDISAFSGGYVGVDIFFVLSGYLITRKIIPKIAKGNFSLTAFYVARIRRLLPALLATVVVTMAFGVLLYSPDALTRLSGSAIAGVLSLANIRYWQVSGYFDTASSAKPLLHLWSLSVEEQFYFVWPIMLLVLFKFVSDRNASTKLIAFIAFVSFFCAQYTVERFPTTAFYLMPFRAYEFGFGALLASYELVKSSKGSTDVRMNLFGALGLLLVTISVIQFDKLTPFPGYYSLVPCLGTLLLIVARNSELARLLLAGSIMRSLGKISYSLYLVHWPVWVMLSFWYFKPFSPLQKLVVCGLMFFLAGILYFTVEKKYRYTQHGRGDSKFLISLATLISITIVAAFMIRMERGLPNRVSNNYVIDNYHSNVECEYPRGDKSLQRCTYGVLESPVSRVLVIGDSHSMNMSSGLDHFGQKFNIGFRSYSVPGCVPLIDVEIRLINTDKRFEYCREFSQKLKTILSGNDFETVLISARWMWYYEHETYHMAQNPPQSFLVDNRSRSLTAQSSKEVWLRAVHRTVDFARSQDKKVVLLSQPALLSDGIGECDNSPKYLLSSDHDIDRCAVKIPFAKLTERLAYTDSAIENLKSKDVFPIIPIKQLCDFSAKQCDLITPRGLLYQDDNHLSAIGGRELIESVSVPLSKFIIQ